MSVFIIVGYVNLNVLGLAPRPALQNILGNNWPSPPLECTHVSYVYVEGDEVAAPLARQYQATFRAEDVWVDGNRTARLIYHDNGAQAHFGNQILCLLVVETAADGRKWLHLVHMPPAIPPLGGAKPRPFSSQGSQEEKK